MTSDAGLLYNVKAAERIPAGIGGTGLPSDPGPRAPNRRWGNGLDRPFAAFASSEYPLQAAGVNE